jgi:hypothetical protein
MPNGKKYCRQIYMPFPEMPIPKELSQENFGILMQKEPIIVRLAAINYLNPTKNLQAVVVGLVFLNKKTKTAWCTKKTIRME